MVVWGLIAVAVYVFFFNNPFSREPDPPYTPLQIETTPSPQSTRSPSDIQPVEPEPPNFRPPDGSRTRRSRTDNPSRFRTSGWDQNVLTSCNSRYCLAQKIRLEGARSRVDRTTQESVDRFLDMPTYFKPVAASINITRVTYSRCNRA